MPDNHFLYTLSKDRYYFCAKWKLTNRIILHNIYNLNICSAFKYNFNRILLFSGIKLLLF